MKDGQVLDFYFTVPYGTGLTKKGVSWDEKVSIKEVLGKDVIIVNRFNTCIYKKEVSGQYIRELDLGVSIIKLTKGE